MQLNKVQLPAAQLAQKNQIDWPLKAAAFQGEERREWVAYMAITPKSTRKFLLAKNLDDAVGAVGAEGESRMAAAVVLLSARLSAGVGCKPPATYFCQGAFWV